MANELQELDSGEVLEVLKQELIELGNQLLEEKPILTDVLERVNKNLRQYPELTHLLTDDEIKPLYQVYVRMAEVEKTVAAKSKGGKGGRKLKDSDQNGTKFIDII